MTFFIICLLISSKDAIYALISYFLALLFIVCGCNINIWRKFQHGSIASQQQNRASQNKRLTKTLLFVSILALLSWLPIIIVNYLRFDFESAYSSSIKYIALALCYSNCLVNPAVYALRIPEFRQALSLCRSRRLVVMNREAVERGQGCRFDAGDAAQNIANRSHNHLKYKGKSWRLCCFRRQAAMDKEVYGRDNRAVALTPVTQLRILPTDPSHIQLACEEQVKQDTKL